MLGAVTAYANTPLGTQIDNVATVNYSGPDTPIFLETNTASFEVVARPTPSIIEFFRYAPTAPDAFTTNLNGSEYTPTGDVGASDFMPIGPAQTLGGVTIDTSAPVPLIPASAYFSGELMIVRVIDTGQNGDPGRIETVAITVTADNGDVITLRLFESGTDTGEFYAWVPSTPDPTPQNDTTLTAPKDTELTARYVDAFDSTEVSVDTALVDPFGRLFDSLTGQLINGVRVTIVEDATGVPADVFGVDGVSEYPNTLITGGVVTDAGGMVYDLAEGEFLFPLMRPGEYRLEIEVPEEYSYPSVFGPGSFDGLPNAPFEIIDGSYGASFTVEATGPLNFDVPMDTTRGLTVTKQALSPTASIGDFVAYSVRVENSEDAAMPVRLRDILPRGMRFVDGSARLSDGTQVPGEVSSDALTVYFDAGWVPAGGDIELTYVLAVGPGTPLGEAVNAAMAVNRFGQSLSNVAEAAIEVREDLLRSRSTLVGRVVEDACDGNADWVRELSNGKGVPGVRLYLETGEYVVSDDDGLFHFEGVRPGTHVVQVDTATLPAGLEPMVCEENTRFAGTATSQFVDVQGGAIWRANFFLRRTSAAATAETVSDDVELDGYKDYDLAWLDSASARTEWVYPETDVTPSQQSVNIGIKAPETARVTLSLNGRAVPGLNVQSRITSTDKQMALYRWRGVDINRGANRFVADIAYSDGRMARLEEDIWFVDTPVRARLVADQSVLVADGRTNPVVALRLEDAEGRAVHAGRLVEVDVAPPYALKIEGQLEAEDTIARTEIDVSGIEVGANGVAMVELEPTLETGRVRLTVPLANGREEEIFAYIRPEKRDWIFVGLAESELGSVDADDLSPVETEDLYVDGRLALFAKGMVRGDWLLTLAIDSAQRRGNVDDELFDEIDPSAYYTLYGDRTNRQHDAESRYPLYLRLEKDTFQLLFGDFQTDLRDTQLTRYTRSLSGLRGLLETDDISATAFIAETNQGFVKDELAADGTSGPYRLRVTPIVRASEVITVETRDRTRPDIVMNTRTLTRYVDYEIDYTTGELIFRAPIEATDASFNENVIVVDYETFSDAERNITYGGRAAVRLNDGQIELGASHIHEEGDAQEPGTVSDVTGVDATVRIGERIEARAEYAVSSRKPGEDGTGTDEAAAWMVEAIRQGDRITATAFVREEEAGFGVSQTGSNREGVRRYGVQATALVQDVTLEETGDRRTRTLSAQAYAEDSLVDDSSRAVGELAIQQSSKFGTASLGLRNVSEQTDAGGPRESLMATTSLTRVMPDWGLTVIAAHDAPLGNENSDEVSLFPARTLIGADKRLTQRATLNLRHEMTSGVNASGQNSAIGVTLIPWAGARLNTGISQVSQDSAERLAANFGVDQDFQISDRWSASLGMASRARIDDDGETPVDPFADEAVSPLAEGLRSRLTLEESFVSGFAGLSYRGESAAGSLRGEYRETDTSSRFAAIVGGARELTETVSYAGAARYQVSDTGIGGQSTTIDARAAVAVRPRGEGPVVLNRLDYQYNEASGTSQQWKLVNNFGANAMVSERLQAAGFWGVKYTEGEIAGVNVSGMTNLVGGELRFDITERFDIGLRAMMMANDASSTTEYSFGPSVGVSPIDGAWISLGYNLAGLRDDDFEAAEYAAEGAYVKFRFKVDENDVRGLLDRISPE